MRFSVFPWFPSKASKLTPATFIKAAWSFDANSSQRNKPLLTLQFHRGTAKTNFQPRGCLGLPPLPPHVDVILTTAWKWSSKGTSWYKLISCQHAACKSRQPELSPSHNPRRAMCVHGCVHRELCSNQKYL